MTTHHNAQDVPEEFLSKIEQIVAQSRPEQRKVSGSQTEHPTGELLYDYASGNLEREPASQIRRHLMRCAPCTYKTLTIMRLLHPEAETPRLFDELRTTIQDWTEKITSSIETVTWVTSLWRPQWAGTPVSAADIPAQSHTFSGKDGEIEITCAWRDHYGTTPAYIQISWLANLTVDRELWALFFDPETKEFLSEIPLGKYLEGGKSIPSHILGFNPSTQQWAIAILLKE